MKQMSNSSHLKHFVSSPKIWAPHPGAVPCWGCPCELGGLGAVGQEGFLGSRPRSKANRRVPGEAETKGVGIPNLLTLWTLRGCSQPSQLKRMGRGEEKKIIIKASAFLAWCYYPRASMGWGPLGQNKEWLQTSVCSDGGSHLLNEPQISDFLIPSSVRRLLDPWPLGLNQQQPPADNFYRLCW